MLVYKYRNFNNEYQTNALFKQQLFFSDPNNFNDPYDFSIFLDIPDLADKDILEKTAVEITEGHYGYDDLREFINRKNELIDKLRDKEAFKASLKGQIRWLNKMYDVCCFSKNWNNITQWAHYADSQSGFAIGFETDDLWRTGYSSYANDIKYVESYPKIPLVNYFPNNKSNAEKHFNEVSNLIYFTKLTDWQYENEWRMVKSFWGQMRIERTLTYPIDLIQEIVVGLNIREKDLKEILEFSQKHGIPVFRTATSETQYKLERESIS